MSDNNEITIAWSAAVHQLALAGGQDDAGEKLLELVESGRAPGSLVEISIQESSL